jgi:hypothetical protein
LAFDAQVVEVLGRSHLVSELLRAGLEVAEPVRDRGVDLIAYSDLDERLSSFVACPIQMKASSGESFSIDAKYSTFPNLIIAHVWHVNDRETPICYALTYAETLAVAETVGWSSTRSWTERKYYASTSPSAALRRQLDPHFMTSEKWWSKITGQIIDSKSRA